MSSGPNMSGFNQVASGAVAPRSAGAINASRANPWSGACAGARHNQQYITAASSAGLAAPPQPKR